MPAEDRFHFFISGYSEEIFPGTRLWETPLSGEMGVSSQEPSPNVFDSGLSIGSFLTTGARFLSKNDFSVLKKGLAAFCSKRVSTHNLLSISLHLEKHGAFYHPVRVNVRLSDGSPAEFVLNGAVSPAGRSLIESEYASISMLRKSGFGRFLPAVFGKMATRVADAPVGFFLGEWFSGYNEFHLTRQRGRDELVIWESDGRSRFIPFAEGVSVYEQAAAILTSLYNIETCEQVFPWHHAAGDFIIRERSGRFDVRLITVRGYAPLSGFESSGDNPSAHILPSLLLFFAHMTVRMRIDRLDGTGELVFLDHSVLTAAAKGFVSALKEKSRRTEVGDISPAFCSFFDHFNADQLSSIMENILQSYPAGSPELGLIRENLGSHCDGLAAIFKSS